VNSHKLTLNKPNQKKTETEEDLKANLNKLFDEFDLNHDGVLQRRELAKMIRILLAKSSKKKRVANQEYRQEYL
jgi:Ca2+-binding EF-hand superfamily protein